jgi:vacuolar-type H+-ATPase subunit F/Vma7
VGVVVVLGEPSQVDGFALAGAIVIRADAPDQVRRAWDTLPPDTSLLVLTTTAAAALDGAVRPGDALTVVMPQ